MDVFYSCFSSIAPHIGGEKVQQSDRVLDVSEILCALMTPFAVQLCKDKDVHSNRSLLIFKAEN